jgi:hypothetical protein
MNWVAARGVFEFSESQIVFKGEPIHLSRDQPNEKSGLMSGIAVCSQTFVGGEISAQFKFDEVGPSSNCDLMFYYDPATESSLSAGLGAGPMAYAIRQWDSSRHLTSLAHIGDRQNIKPGRDYHLVVSLRGSRVSLRVDDVEILVRDLQVSLPPSQVGIRCYDNHTITISKFQVDSRTGQVFVIMPLTQRFEDIYQAVVKEVCNKETFGLEAHNAAETYEPGPIMPSVYRDIIESEFVIAEITSSNPNVFYELGFAHAINKPVIMIADRQQVPTVPFDISSHRILFYENSIAGKDRFEEGLRRYISEILEKRSLPQLPLGSTPTEEKIG